MLNIEPVCGVRLPTDTLGGLARFEGAHVNNRFMSAAVAILATGSVASAKDAIPNMVGVWTGTTHTVVVGEGGNWVGNQGNFERPGLFERPTTFEVLGQDGRRFWGRSITQGGSGPQPFVGSLRVGKRQFVASDAEGSYSGALLGKNTFEYCYLNVPGPVNKAAIVSCSVLKRETSTGSTSPDGKRPKG